MSLLRQLEGLVLADYYVLCEPVACGGSSVVLKALDTRLPGRNLACKFSLLPYDSPALISGDHIQQGRKRLREEFTILLKLNGSLWPKPESLVRGLNPIFPAPWGDEVRRNEEYLLMEWVEGNSIAERCRQFLSGGEDRVHEMEGIVRRVIGKVVPALLQAYQRGFLYTDLKPDHIILCDEEGTIVRLLDANGACKRYGRPATTELTPGYVRPEVYSAWTRGERLIPDESWVIHGFGKTLLASCSNWEVLPGKEYRASDYLPQLSVCMQEYIDGLLQVRWKTLADLQEATRTLLNVA